MPTSRNGSKYDFWVSTTVTEDNENLRYKVTSTAKLRVNVYKFQTSNGGSIVVDNGNSAKKAVSSSAYGDSKTEKTYNMATVTTYYNYSYSDRTINISAKSSVDISSGGYGPGKCSWSGTKTLKAKLSSSGRLSVGSKDQTYADVTMSGLPSASYRRIMKWYQNGTKVETHDISKSTNSKSRRFGGLLPNTAYTFGCEVWASDANDADPRMVYSTASTTTPVESGTLRISPGTTYISGTVSDMYNYPTYSRTIRIYYSIGNGWQGYTSFTCNASSGNFNITGLVSNRNYSVRVDICNGSTVYKTLTASTTTVADASLIPIGIINGVTQKLGTRELTIAWTSSKNVSGTTYVLEYNNNGVWTALKTVTSIQSPFVVNSPIGNQNIQLRIKSTNTSVLNSSQVSAVETFFVRDDFFWDVPKEVGRVIEVTAREWNRLGDYVMAKSAQKGMVVDIPQVRSGEPLTSVIYNKMKNHINDLTPIDIADKKPGEAMSITDLNKLKEAINRA